MNHLNQLILLYILVIVNLILMYYMNYYKITINTGLLLLMVMGIYLLCYKVIINKLYLNNKLIYQKDIRKVDNLLLDLLD